jgi:cell wall-associated NlpC family hydrolase
LTCSKRATAGRGSRRRTTNPGWVREETLGEFVEREWPARRDGDVLDEARAYVGAPYQWGGMTAAGIDCSGLVHMAFRRLGILVPRDSWQQEEAGAEVAEDDLRPGDLACYDGHVAFWLGVRILHASGRPRSAGCSKSPSHSN